MMEIGNCGRINFLDTTIIIENQKIIFDRYQKITFSRRFLSFYLHHPLCHKLAIVYGMVDRIKVSYPCFYQKNLVNAIHTLLNNGYSLFFVFF